LNKPEMLARVGGNAELLGELVEIFFETYPGLAQRMSHAIAEHDCHSLENAVHTLKSSLGNFSAFPSLEAVAALEEGISSHNTEEISRAYKTLVKEVERLMPVLADLVQEQHESPIQ